MDKSADIAGGRTRAPRRTHAPPEFAAAPTQGKAYRVYVGNVSWSTTAEELKNSFAGKGFNTLNSNIPLDSRGRSRGFGIVELTSADDVARAITDMHDTELGGRKLFVREDREEEVPSTNPPPRGDRPRREREPRGPPAAGGAMRDSAPREPRGDREPKPNATKLLTNAFPAGTVIHVSNLPFDITWKELKDIFSGVGKIVRADIATRGEKSAGWGTVAFSTAAEADKAIKEFNRALVNEREITVRLYTTSGPAA